jgi:hypothetical protein
MDVLLRELRTGSDGIVERHDTEFSGERVVIGSAPDANVQLLGEGIGAKHATITGDGAQLQLRCARDCRVLVNGEEVDTATLSLDTVVEIAGNQLKVVAVPTGFHFAIEIKPDPHVDSSQFEQAFQTDIDQVAISKRKLSWWALGAVLVLCLALPLVSVMVRDHTTSAPALLPSDALWSSRDLASAHAQAAGTQCASCHRDLFVRVRDTECRDCHKNMTDHVHADRAALTELDTQRCATCHREHGSLDELIARTDGGCTSCHADASTRFANLKLTDAQAFEPEQHPPFAARIAMPVPIDGVPGAFEWRTNKTVLADARENSNLKFSHQQHLDADKVIRNSDGQGMSCNDCHRPFDAERFEPITMQGACASCHELAFDPANPERQLPHGKPREVVLALQEYFARRYADPAAAPVVRERRRLPGRTRDTVECTGNALMCARQAAENEIAAQFTQSGCVTCHEVTDTESNDIYERYRVLPVRLSADFFPASRFDHTAHRIQKTQTGDAACMTCHKVNESMQSADLLLPNEKHCMDCHRSDPARHQIASSCSSCHTYHPSEQLGHSPHSAATAAAASVQP